MSQEEVYDWLQEQRVRGNHAFIRADMISFQLGKNHEIIRRDIMRLYLSGFLDVEIVPGNRGIARAYRIKDKYVVKSSANEARSPLQESLVRKQVPKHQGAK